MAKAFVKNINGTPTLVIDEKPYYGNAITITNNRDGELRLNEEYLENLGKSGIKIFFLICDTNFTKPDAYDLFKKEAEAILKAVPDAYIIPRVGLHPTKEWVDAHPNAIIEFSDGEIRDAHLRTESYKAFMKPYSLHSDEWKKDAGAALIEFCERAQNETFGDRIIGYFICAGSTSEWHPSMPGGSLLDLYMQNIHFDTSENFKKAFQEYLDEKYGENAPKAEIPVDYDRFYITHFDEKVKKIKGGKPHETTPEAPTEGKCHGSFPLPEKCKNAVDFYMAWGDATAKSILYFAGLVKERWPDKITGSFYSYTRWSQMTGGLSGTKRILKDNRLDFCAAPSDYQNRQPGGWEAIRSPYDSMRVNNMLFFAEDDTRTHKENLFYRSGYGVYDETDTKNVMKRNFGKDVCSVNYAWWFDQHYAGGRYNDKACLDIMKKQAEISKEISQNGRYKDNDIAFVYDLESYMAVSHDSTQHTITTMKNFSLGKIGAPYDEYILDDFANENMKDYKLYIFPAACMMNDEKIALIKKKLQKNHATALWLYGAGYINADADDIMSTENIKKLTGFSVKEQFDYAYDTFFKICGDEKINQNLVPQRLYGKIDMITPGNKQVNSSESRPYLCPLFYIDENEEGIFAKFCEVKKAAAGIKEFDGFTSVWCGAKFVQADFIRAVALEAGCHLYSMDFDVIYEGSGYLTIHATSSGKKEIHLKNKCNPYEVYEEKEYGTNVDTITLDMYEGETKMFKIR